MIATYLQSRFAIQNFENKQLKTNNIFNKTAFK